MANPRSAAGFRLDPELHDRLKAAAAARGLTLNTLVNTLLAESVEWLIPAAELRLTRRPAVDALSRAAGPDLTGDCEDDCQVRCAYPGQFSECDIGANAAGPDQGDET